MDKAKILEAAIAQLEESGRQMKQAARDAHAEATDPETHSENEYDTRGLEASYLARGQALQLDALAEDLLVLKQCRLPDYAAGDPAGPGALVRVETDGQRNDYLLLPRAGGLEVTVGRQTVTVVTESSPIGQQLVGRKKGGTFALRRGEPMIRVLSVC